MGIIKVLADAYNAATGTLEGGLADQFLEVIEPDDMGATTAFTSGVLVNRKDRRGGNRQAGRGPSPSATRIDGASDVRGGRPRWLAVVGCARGRTEVNPGRGRLSG